MQTAKDNSRLGMQLSARELTYHGRALGWIPSINQIIKLSLKGMGKNPEEENRFSSVETDK